MIAQSRLDAGWSVPWYVAEVSFHNASSLSSEVPVAAGRVLPSTATPWFSSAPAPTNSTSRTPPGKLKDLVHFNAAGLLDHATQWKEILLGMATIDPKNPGFEDNHTPTITGQSALADGVSYVLSVSNLDSPMVLDWRILPPPE